MKLFNHIKLNTESRIQQRLAGLTLTLLLSLSLPVHSEVKSALQPSQVNLQKVLAQHKGQVIYLDFWASWCVPCRKSFPWMNKMQQLHQQQGFAVVSVNLDAEQSLARAFLEQNNANFPVVYDPKGHIAQHFNIKGMPSSMLIDREGNIQQRHSGFFNNKIKSYEAEISALLNQK